MEALSPENVTKTCDCDWLAAEKAGELGLTEALLSDSGYTGRVLDGKEINGIDSLVD